MPKKLRKTKIKKKRKIESKKKAFKMLKRVKGKKLVKPITNLSLLDRKNYLKGPIKKIKIRVIGIGGGGGSIVSEIAQRISTLGKEKISFVVANTDLKALRRKSSKAIRFPFGQSLTFGLGTGMNPQLGRLTAQKEKEKIQKILEGGDLTIFVASLGGGVGSGAAPIFAKVAQDLGLLSYGFFTLPFKFEGEKKMEIAKNALRKLKPYLNALSIIPNERIFQVIDKKTPLTNALSVINKILAKSLEGLLEIIYQPGLINIDFADLKTILAGDAALPSSGKIAYLNTVEIEGQNKAQEVIKNLISNPLYPYSISGAEGILFNISGEPSLKLTEVNEISQAIWALSHGEAKIIFGISENRELKDKLKVTLLATRCQTNLPISRKTRKKTIRKIGKEKVKKQKIKIKLGAPVKTEEKSENKFLAVGTGFMEKIGSKDRKNALQVRKALQEEEEKIIAKEKIWETPTFLRKRS